MSGAAWFALIVVVLSLLGLGAWAWVRAERRLFDDDDDRYGDGGL